MVRPFAFMSMSKSSLKLSGPSSLFLFLSLHSLLTSLLIDSEIEQVSSTSQAPLSLFNDVRATLIFSSLMSTHPQILQEVAPFLRRHLKVYLDGQKRMEQRTRPDDALPSFSIAVRDSYPLIWELFSQHLKRTRHRLLPLSSSYILTLVALERRGLLQMFALASDQRALASQSYSDLPPKLISLLEGHASRSWSITDYQSMRPL